MAAICKIPRVLTTTCRLIFSRNFKTDLNVENLYPGSSVKDRFSVKKVDPEGHPSGFNGIINFDEVKV
jgi:hypothetical protein